VNGGPAIPDQAGSTEGRTVMGTVRIVTDESFEAEVLRNSKPVIVECWAQWCGPCRQVAPVLDAIAAEHADKIDVVKLNVDENPETAQRYAIMLVPTLNVFSGGEIVKQVIGAKSKSALLREFAEFV
jgi:thioredoxin 1